MGASALGVLAALVVPPPSEKPALFAALMEGVGAAVAASGQGPRRRPLRGEALSPHHHGGRYCRTTGRARRAGGRPALGHRPAGGARAALEAWNGGRIPAPGARERCETGSADSGRAMAGPAWCDGDARSERRPRGRPQPWRQRRRSGWSWISARCRRIRCLREAFAVGRHWSICGAGWRGLRLLVAMPRTFPARRVPVELRRGRTPGQRRGLFRGWIRAAPRRLRPLRMIQAIRYISSFIVYIVWTCTGDRRGAARGAAAARRRLRPIGAGLGCGHAARHRNHGAGGGT